jgi:hypothetical protein
MIAGQVDGVEIARDWIFQGEYLRAFCDNSTCTRVRVNFDHRRAGRAEFDAPQLFAGPVRHGYASMVIQSAANDYYLNPDLPKLRAALADYVTRFDDVSGMGFSMGGFAALLLSRALHFSNIWLISPMSPSLPKTPPFLTDLCGELALLDGVQADMRGVVMFDPYFEAGRDRAYAQIVQRLCPKVALLAMPWGGHPATQFLSEALHYSPMLRATFQPHIRAKVLKKVQRRFRTESARYLAGVQDYLEQRADRITER